MEFGTGESSKELLKHGALAAGVPGFKLVSGHVGDHRLVHALLRAANQKPTYEHFLAGLDEPTYEPSDRLLIKLDNQLIAHVLVLRRNAWFDHHSLPIGWLHDMAILPEYQARGYEQFLVSAAERAARDHQALAAFVCTDQPALFQAAGWSEIGDQRFTQASVHDILGALHSPRLVKPLRRQRVPQIRLWRQVELDGLRHFYRQTAASAWGALDRSEAYWRWLVGRKDHDQLIVAIHGRDNWEELLTPSRIVGYAMTRGSQVVELATLQAFEPFAHSLLERACQDAIEHNHRSVTLHIRRTEPLHKLMISAGGTWNSSKSAGGRTRMFKLLDPTRWIESLRDVLLRRAAAAGLALPLTISFASGLRKYRFELTHQASQLRHDCAAIADVRCSLEALGGLFVGNLDSTAACAAGQFEVLSERTIAHLAALFPVVTFWQSQFDSPPC